MSLTPVGDLGIALKSDVDDFHKGMRTSKDSVGLLTGSIRGLSAAMRNMGIVVTGASALVGAGMLTLSRRAERVNAAFREVDSISTEVANSQEEYGDLVSELNTEFGLQTNRLDTISALYQSVSASVDEGEESQREFLTTAGDLAMVGLVDLETSVDVLSTAMNAYGEDTGFAEEAAEALFQTVQFGKVRLEELAPVMGRITALGSEMDVSIQELGASMAVLTRTGFEARVAATGLRAILRSFMRPSEAMKDALRDIAMEQDGLVESLTAGHSELDGMAQQYRETTAAIEELSQAQAEAREQQEEANLEIQRSRLAIQAIEEDRIDQLEDAETAELARGNSIEELEQRIEDYRFTVNQARVVEEDSRQEKEDLEAEVDSLIDKFSEQLDVAGDLEGGIGQLVVEEEGMVDTLIKMREVADEQNIAFDEFFPRTRALQGALALVGEDGEQLRETFEDMTEGTFNAEEAWADLDEETRNSFESFEDFKTTAEEMRDFDLSEAADEMRGPQEQMRNAISELEEAAQDLGQVFNEPLTDAISNFAGWIETLVDKFNSLEDSAQDNIGRFGVLAVSIGLILGPLLLLGGQFALIASAMGGMFIPFIILAGSLIGILANSLLTASEGGEEAEGMFSRMENTFSGLIDFLVALKDAFMIVLPGLIEAGKALFSVFSTIKDTLGEVISGATEGEDPLTSLAEWIRDIFFAIAEWLEKNEELIAAVVGFFAGILIKDILTAHAQIVRGIMAVVSAMFYFLTETTTGRVLLTLLAGTILAVVKVVTGLVWVIGKLLEVLAPVLGPLIAIVGILGSLVLGFGLFMARVAAVTARFVGFIARSKTAISFLARLRNSGQALRGALNILQFRLAGVTGTFGPLASGLRMAITWLLKTRNGVYALASVLRTGLVVAVGLALGAIVDWFLWLYNRLVGNSIVPDMMGAIYDVVIGRLDDIASIVFQKGKNIAGRIADGLRAGVGAVKGAIGNVTSTIGRFLPSSPADEGELAVNPPKDSGMQISEDLVEGMDEGIKGYEMDTGSMVPDGENMDMSFQNESFVGESPLEPKNEMNNAPSDIPGEKKVEISVDEHAIYFESGAFQGVSDEELPEKVRDTVDESMDEIVRDLEDRGVEVI